MNHSVPAATRKVPAVLVRRLIPYPVVTQLDQNVFTLVACKVPTVEKSREPADRLCIWTRAKVTKGTSPPSGDLL